MDDSPQFLGWGERAPVIDVTPSYAPFFATVSGTEVPLELLYNGLSGRVTVDLTLFNYNVLRAVQTRVRGNAFNAIDPGLDDAGMIGTPLISGGCVPKLYLRFPFAGKPTYRDFVNGNLIEGYRFFAAVLDPETVRGGSGQAHKVALNWKCLRGYDLDAKTNYGRGSLRLFDNDMGDLQGRLGD